MALVDLVAVVSVLCVAGSILFPALVRAKQNSTLMACRANLRQIGLALQMYTEASNGSLPGPLVLEVRAGCDGASRQELLWFLAEYLALPKPQSSGVTSPVFVCPTYHRLWADGKSATTYLLNEDVNAERGSTIRPFGNPGSPPSPPLSLLELQKYGSPSGIFAVTDLDKGNVNPQARCWNELAYTPVHGKLRNLLMFDWHVESKAW